MAPVVPAKRSAAADSSPSSAALREAVRSTAASVAASVPVSSPSPPLADSVSQAGQLLRQSAADASAEARLLCCEEVDGRRWSYVLDQPSGRRGGGGERAAVSLRAVSMETPVTPLDELISFVRSYVVPEGFPDSVAPSYVPYMSWRAMKHFFGGAMGVLTTQALLCSVGMSKNTATSGAVAINWILKDGAGRVGKMLFARQGKKFDYDLKQLRFTGDLLMEIGAGIELATAAVPQLFLPLACVANVVKNVSAVTSTSTRTPIYKAYAKGENIGDVTAKAESVGNITDLLGTGLSILISKRNPSLVTSFALISCGYLFCSYREVKSVVLNTLNRARFSVAVESFVKTGYVPSLEEGNSMEKIFDPPWRKQTQVVLGQRFGEAFTEPAAFLSIKPLFEDEKYVVTYNPSKDKIYAVLKARAKSDDILKAAFHAHVLLYLLRSSNMSHYLNNKFNDSKTGKEFRLPKNMFLHSHIAKSCEIVSSCYGSFKKKSTEQGWIMSDSLLNPGRARIHGFREE